MESKEVFRELESLLNDLSIKIKYRKGYFSGGICRYQKQRTLYLNSADKIENHVSIIINELKYIDLNGVMLSPSLKNLLASSRSK
jgi:hypothetical protein